MNRWTGMTGISLITMKNCSMAIPDPLPTGGNLFRSYRLWAYLNYVTSLVVWLPNRFMAKSRQQIWWPVKFLSIYVQA